MGNTTSVGYVGEVTLTYKLNGKTIKVKKFNKGWSNLFRFIALCLTDNMDTLSSSRPQYLDIKCKKVNTTNWESCLFKRIPVTPSFTYEQDAEMDNYGGVNYFSVFTTTISYGMLNLSQLDRYGSDPQDECALFLLSGDDYNVADGDASVRMAQLLLDLDSLKTIQAGTQILIEWVLKFYNK